MADILELSTTDFPRRTVKIDGEPYMMRTMDEMRDSDLKQLFSIQKSLTNSDFDQQTTALSEAINMIMVDLPDEVMEKIGIGLKMKILDFFSQRDPVTEIGKSQNSSASMAAGRKTGSRSRKGTKKRS